ncbi:hypothetical protein NBH00_01240 [Paraconexibacter antarcticus]|uniref:PRC-barrel domain-containing protein n=1 Tax=Paraconexibacter antarcticus TaxID=2949664 RepID=A0ABY5DVH3_9ACTN|nr:hypothetical protein [Paraconexibacter antarcticus]UTI64847.1 hypothetical protein NBH00_01240 [Paraconexibacter antarcticus]
MPVSRTRLAVATTVVLVAALAPAGQASAAGHHARPHAKKHAAAKTSRKTASKAKKKGTGIRRAVAGASRSFTSADGTSIGTITAFDAATGHIRLVLEDGSVVQSRLSPDADVRCAPAAGFAAEDQSSGADGAGAVADAQSAGYDDGYSDGEGGDAPNPAAGLDGMTAAEAAAYTAAYTTGYADGSTGADMADPNGPASASAAAASPNDGDGCLALLDAGMKVYGVAVKATPRGRALTELDVIVTPAQLDALDAADAQAAAGDPGATDPGAGDNSDDPSDGQGGDN